MRRAHEDVHGSKASAQCARRRARQQGGNAKGRAECRKLGSAARRECKEVERMNEDVRGCKASAQSARERAVQQGDDAKKCTKTGTASECKAVRGDAHEKASARSEAAPPEEDLTVKT